MPAVLVDVSVPIDHGLVSAFDSLDHAVGQELVIVRQQGGSLLGFHAESAAKSIQDEFKRALRVAWITADIHRHDVHAVLDWLLLRRLQASSSLDLAVGACEVLLASATQIAALPIISAVVLEAEDIGVAGEPLDILFDSQEEPADFLRVSGHVEALDVILDDDSNFLKNINIAINKSDNAVRKLTSS